MEARILKKSPPLVTFYSRYTSALTVESSCQAVYLLFFFCRCTSAMTVESSCQAAYFASCETEPTIYSPTFLPPSPHAAPPTAAQKLGAVGQTREVRVGRRQRLRVSRQLTYMGVRKASIQRSTTQITPASMPMLWCAWPMVRVSKFRSLARACLWRQCCSRGRQEQVV